MTVAGHAGTQRRPGPFGAWRVTLLVVSSLVGIAALAAVAGGVAALVLDRTQRDGGYLSTGPDTYATDTYAIVSESYRAGAAGDWFTARDMLGTIRIEMRADRPVFVGIGRAADVDRYLGSVRREETSRFTGRRSDLQLREGAAPASPPVTERFWAASVAGTGAHALTWEPQEGAWRVVLMNADGSAGVRAELAAGARFPHLLAFALGALGAGAALLLLAVGGGWAALRRRD